MPTKIYLEAQRVYQIGVDTQYWHLYLVKSPEDASGNITEEMLIRGDRAASGSLVVQADISLVGSADDRTLGSRPQVDLDLGGRDAQEVWKVMTQHAKEINDTKLPYSIPFVGNDPAKLGGNELNSNTVAASTLHAVGIDITPYLEKLAKLNGLVLNDNAPPGDDFVFVGNVPAMTVNDVLHGGNHRDIIWGGTGQDDIAAGAGNDEVRGEAGNDTFNGGLGDDLIDGGLGDDVMTGGAGHDKFEVFAGNDTIMDFNFQEDSLWLPGGMTISGALLNGQDTRLTYPGGGTVTLVNVNLGPVASQYPWLQWSDIPWFTLGPGPQSIDMVA